MVVLLIGWLAFWISGRRPWIANVVVILLLLLRLGMFGHDRVVLDQFITEVQAKAAAAKPDIDEFARAGAFEPQTLASVKAIDDRLALLRRIQRQSADCARLIDSDKELRTRMAAEHASQGAIDRAVNDLQASTEVGMAREVLQSNERLFRAGEQLLTVLHDQFGHWHVAEDGKLVFDRGIPSLISLAANEAMRAIEHEGSVQAALQQRLTPNSGTR